MLLDVSGCVFTDQVSCTDPVTPIANSSEYVMSNVGSCEGGNVVFSAPLSKGGKSINVFQECVQGTCNCIHYVGGNAVDLRPCRAAQFLFGGECNLPSDMVSEIWNGLCDGFRVVDDVEIPEYSCENYASITEGTFYDDMSAIICSELVEGKISEVTVRPHCVHALGGVEKSNGKLRPITDCSRPDGVSVNNFMSDVFKNFSYKSVDDVTQCLQGGEFISVTDISSAYRSVSIFEDHSKYQGFSWEMDGETRWYQENRLCFGLRTAPFIFNQLSELIVDMARSEWVNHIVNYLDDFAVVGSTREECALGQQILIGVLRRLGFSVSWDKLIAPAREVNFLGIIINTEKMNLSLPL